MLVLLHAGNKVPERISVNMKDLSPRFRDFCPWSCGHIIMTCGSA